MRNSAALWVLVGVILAVEAILVHFRLHFTDFILYLSVQIGLAFLAVFTVSYFKSRGDYKGAGTGAKEDQSTLDVIAQMKGLSIVRLKGILIATASLFLAIYHLYHGFAGAAEPVAFLMTHLGFVLFLAFLLVPFDGRDWRKSSPWTLAIDIPLALASLAVMVYVIHDVDAFIWRRSAYALPDMVVGTVLMALILEATRRTVGWAMVLLACGMLFYANQADRFPAVMMAAPSRWDTIVNTQFMETLGIFSVPLQVAATYIVLFLIFGGLFMRTGAGQFFMNMAYSLTGGYSGGPAKASVVASSLFGSISGSAVANVTSTGSFTIPLMKRTGFKPQFAAATEAVASTGGQLMPPVMGAAAFVVAEFVGTSYLNVATAALIPSLLFYLALFMMVHLEAQKLGLAGLPRHDLPVFSQVMARGWHLLTPLFVIVGILLAGYTPTMAGFWGCVSVVVASLSRRGTYLPPGELLDALQGSVRGVVSVSIACATAGIIIGCMFTSGLGIRLSSMIVTVASGQVWLVLLLAMLCSLVLGMGMTTTAVYITVAIMIAPALIELGIDPIAAHLFVLYFGVMSNVTPPVAIASFAAAGVANSPPMRTSLVAARLAIVGFLVPFAFVYGPGLVLVGDATSITVTMITAVLGVVALAFGLQGWILGRLGVVNRILLAAASIALITADTFLDSAGLIVFVVVIVSHLISRKVPQMELEK